MKRVASAMVPVLWGLLWLQACDGACTAAPDSGPSAHDAGRDAGDATIDASDGGLDASGGGLDASDGGLDASDGGVDASDGGLDASDGGVDASDAGHGASDGGVDASDAGHDASDAHLDECALDNGGCGDPASWTCSDSAEAPPTCTDRCVVPAGSVALPMLLRDFQISHPDMEAFVGADTGIVQAQLGTDGTPVYAGAPTTPTTTGQANFEQWYHDAPGINFTVSTSLVLDKLGTGESRYASSAFFPLDGQGWGNEGNAHNFHFTTEIRFPFRYSGLEAVSFTGDDDIWIFVNGRLVTDLGGVHGPLSATVPLDAAAAAQYGLTPGSVHELAVFHAERHTTQSTYQLTLAGFALCPLGPP